MWGDSYIGDQLLRIEINPFNENGSNTSSSNSTPDPRANAFLESLRARVSTQDEAQRETWLKARKTGSRRKQAQPANPGEPTTTKRAQSATNSGAVEAKAAAGAAKKRPKRRPASD
jgi:hypothetical protein